MTPREKRAAKRYGYFRYRISQFVKVMNQGEIAEAAGISRQYLNKIINDEDLTPSIQVCLAIADVMRRPLGDLLKR